MSATQGSTRLPHRFILYQKIARALRTRTHDQSAIRIRRMYVSDSLHRACRDCARVYPRDSVYSQVEVHPTDATHRTCQHAACMAHVQAHRGRGVGQSLRGSGVSVCSLDSGSRSRSPDRRRPSVCCLLETTAANPQLRIIACDVPRPATDHREMLGRIYVSSCTRQASPYALW